MLDLQRDAAAVRRDDGLAFVDCFRDFDFKAFPGGELEDGMRGGEESVEDLVVGGETHDGDGGYEVREVGFEVVHGLVEDEGAVWVVDGSVAADHELRGFDLWVVDGEQAAEFSVGLDDIRDAFCWIETCDLYYVFLEGPFDLRPESGSVAVQLIKGLRDGHSDCVTLLVVHVSVVALIPFTHIFVETVKPRMISVR